jgi:hypothetical protein
MSKLISAAPIVKDEERYLPGCLDSIAGRVDDIVLQGSPIIGSHPEAEPPCDGVCAHMARVGVLDLAQSIDPLFAHIARIRRSASGMLQHTRDQAFGSPASRAGAKCVGSS